MSVTVSVNGTNYTIPQTSETGWGNNVTSWIQAVSSSTLQKSGGTFTLSADVDFGASFGLKSLYYKSRNSNPAAAGQIRLGNTEIIGWRNAANSADKTLAVDSSDRLTYAGVPIASASGVVPVASGGTNITSYAIGDILYASGATTLSKLVIGTAGQVLQVNGGATAPQWGSPNAALATAAKTADYTLLSTDDFITVDSDADANGFNITLPDNATNPGKLYTIKRIGTTFATARAVTISRAGSDTITDSVAGLTATSVNTPGEEIEIVSMGTGVWQVISRRIPSVWTAYTPTGSWSANTTYTGFYRRVGDSIECEVVVATSGAPTSANLTVDLPTGLTIDTGKVSAASENKALGILSILDSGTLEFAGRVAYNSTTSMGAWTEKADATEWVEVSQEVNATTPMTFASGDRVRMRFSVPISGWNG